VKLSGDPSLANTEIVCDGGGVVPAWTSIFTGLGPTVRVGTAGALTVNVTPTFCCVPPPLKSMFPG